MELPVMAAQKVKQKLNGSTLKGSKVKIEEAKPDRKRKVELEREAGEEGEDERKVRKMARREKRKREEGVLAGHELEEGRRVKRGWTDGKDEERKTKKAENKDGEGEAPPEKKTKKREKSADAVDGEEKLKMRFKTVVPPNAVPLPKEAKDKAKKPKKEKEGRRSKKMTVVEEFKKTKKPRDITMDSSSHGALTYEDGRGWVDQDGNVIDAERPSKKPKRRKRVEEPVPSLSDSALGDQVMEGAEDHHEKEDDHSEPMDHDAPTNESAKAVSSPSSSSESTAESDPKQAPTDVGADQPHQTVSANTATSPPAQKESTPPAPGVHPLEALFKKPAVRPDSASKPRPGPIDTSFNFFNADAEPDEEAEAAAMPPQTPHTKRDLEWRSLRSAAPTPDTAAIGRKFSFPFAGDNDDDDEGEDGGWGGDAVEDAEMQDAEQNGSAEQSKEGERGEESAFRKWFYEHRGEFNRGWKKRRRDERKVKRQRNNRRVGLKVA